MRERRILPHLNPGAVGRGASAVMALAAAIRPAKPHDRFTTDPHNPHKRKTK